MNKFRIVSTFLAIVLSIPTYSLSINIEPHKGAFLRTSGDGRYIVGEESGRLYIKDRENSSKTVIGAELPPYWPYNTSISQDACIIAFDSSLATIVENDTNGYHDIFVYDCNTNNFERISVSDTGEEGNGLSRYPSVSPDGRYVAFTSRATNLASNDIGANPDVFLHDLFLGTTTNVHVATDGTQGNGGVIEETPGVSNNGEFIVFSSSSSNLDPNDYNTTVDVFLHNRTSGQTKILSIGPNGQQAEPGHYSRHADITPDGRFVTYMSNAHYITGNYLNGQHNIILHNTSTNSNHIVSTSVFEDPNNLFCQFPKISANGRFVAFRSAANNLIADDNNNTGDIFIKDVLTGEIEYVNDPDDGFDYFSGQDITYWNRLTISENGRFVGFTIWPLDSSLRDMALDNDEDFYVVFKDIEVQDCNDNDPAINPGATEICDGIDNNCDGQIDEGFDIDNDGYTVCQGDLYDNDPTINPGATETKHDGIDQDCNGYDLTIDITAADYNSKDSLLAVKATSALGMAANLEVVGYGPMTWKDKQQVWMLDFTGPNPGTVTVTGPEGSEMLTVTVQ